MTPDELKQRLSGVLAFAPTPFTAEDRLDCDGLARHVDFLCRSGVGAVFVCGGVGEFFALDPDEYRTCLRTAVEAAAKRVPVVAGIAHGTRTACQLAAYASAVGADGLLVHPFYFAAPSDDGIVQHYQALAKAASLGLVIYHTREAVYVPALVERLAENELVVALKDEVGDLKSFLEMRARLGERLAWINGMAELLVAPYLAAGAQAMTTGIVNFAPQLSLAVWQAAVAGRHAELDQLLNTKIRPLARLRERRKGYAIAIVKEAMNLLGMSGGSVRLPLTPVQPADRAELRLTLQQLGILQGPLP
jgi:5-dehydro-4-deoxyglucarate dehydratase